MSRHGVQHASAAWDGWAVLDAMVLLALVAAAAAYAVALRRALPRGRWPIRRVVSWYLGVGCAAAATLGPLADAARATLTGHMLAHLLLGMLSPLLLVLGAPITLALRALPVRAARGLVRVLRTPVVGALTHPLVAALLNGGGLWLITTTELYGLMHASPVVHGLVHLHFLLSGYLLTAALVGVDPDPHRASIPARGAVLIAFIAAHSILAKLLFAHPPDGVAAPDAQLASQVMYYGGDAIDVVLLMLLGLRWYRATEPRGARATGAAAA